ncbi:four-helix bundle copper-binding protein [Pseudomonas putida]|uniref:four-helix bundle copper-binding protein n=1 Tax=Pseudomonas putida TaxID=303 RepID=UPI000A120413|nr:four-helix bundle copper-binding protein [Pseudomonas putida]ORL53319.1 hypothetical protein B7H18_02710 [Pseudomonas putida]
MQRREMLKAVAGTVAIAMTASVMAATETHEHHHEHGATDGKDFAGLVNTSADCLKTGEACLAHSITLLSQGDKEMAACAQSVSELLATCDALMKLAAQKSKFTPAMAKVTAEVCASCEKQCRKYEDVHAECKDCADACAACVKECNAIAA